MQRSVRRTQVFFIFTGLCRSAAHEDFCHAALPPSSAYPDGLDSHVKQEPEDAGRGKRRRKAILTPQQLAGALDGAHSVSSSGSDFATETAAAAADAAASELDSSGGDSDDLVPENEEDNEPGPEPGDDLIEDVVDAVRRPPAKRCARAGRCADNACRRGRSSCLGGACYPRLGKIIATAQRHF